MRAKHWTMIGLLVGGCFVDGGGEEQPGTSSTGATTEAVTESASTGSPEGQACDPFAQDCPAGFKCAPYASDGGDVWDANKCVPVTGNDAPGQGCSADGGGTSGYDTCVAGALCMGVTRAGVGTCVSLCGGSAEAPTCSPGLACLSTNDGALNQCVQICDPLLAGDCALSSDVCVPNGDNFVCIADAWDGVKEDFSPCEYINECGAGRFCGDAGLAPSACAGVTSCCLPVCSLMAMTPTCPDATTCTAYYSGEVPPKYVDLGYCGQP